LDKLKEIFKWLESWFEAMVRKAIELAKKLVPSAPEKGEEVENRIIELAKFGAVALGGMTGLSMVVSTLSRIGLGHLSAIIYDFTGYKYITGAIMGVLALCAYKQPLTYYYNSLFQPYLPSLHDALAALGEGAISDEDFKHILKYNGIPEKYFPWYKELSDRPPSGFMLRYLAEAEIVAPNDIFGMCVESGYPVEWAILMTYAMAYGAMGKYRSAIDTALLKCYREGFITLDTFKKEFKINRTSTEVPVKYTSLTGHTTAGVVKIPLTQEELMTRAAKWESFYDSCLDKVEALKSEYQADKITYDEFSTRLAEIVIVPERAKDIALREKAKKRVRVEPERGKTLRDALKAILRKCYREGYITHARLEAEIKASNRVVDEESLILAQAEWEAFADDMADILKSYISALKIGAITESQFRDELIAMGFRPSKVEAYIKLDQVKKLLGVTE
jgi:hypothetical protein